MHGVENWITTNINARVANVSSVNNAIRLQHVLHIAILCERPQQDARQGMLNPTCLVQNDEVESTMEHVPLQQSRHKLSIDNRI